MRLGGYSESDGMILVTMELELRYVTRVSASPPEITVNVQEENGVVNEDEKTARQEDLRPGFCCSPRWWWDRSFLCVLPALPGHIRRYELRKLNGSHTELSASFHHTFEIGLVVVLWRFCRLLRPH